MQWKNRLDTIEQFILYKHCKSPPPHKSMLLMGHLHADIFLVIRPGFISFCLWYLNSVIQWGLSNKSPNALSSQ